MPIFTYKCKHCGHEFEVIRKFSDTGRERCPECKEELTLSDRLVGKTSFKLSGDGWFSDGYSGGDKESKKYVFQ